MAENCSITYSEAMAMDENDVFEANAALDIYYKQQEKAQKKASKK
jgi:hypothetical protein